MAASSTQAVTTSVTPYLIVQGALKAIDFYVRGLSAIEVFKHEEPSGRVAHAELRIGDAVIMLSEEDPAAQVLGPNSLGGSPVHLVLYVEEVDARVDQAIAAGATLIQAVEDQPYGVRMGGIKDPFGHLWYISTPMNASY